MPTRACQVSPGVHVFTMSSQTTTDCRVLLMGPQGAEREAIADRLRATPGLDVALCTFDKEREGGSCQNAEVVLALEPPANTSWPQWVRQLRRRVPGAPVIVIRATPCHREAVAVLRAGALDYLSIAELEEIELGETLRAATNKSLPLLSDVELWSLMSTLPLIVCSLDSEARLQFVSSMPTGFRGAELLNTPADQFVVPEQRDRFWQAVEKVRESRKPTQYEILGLMPDGTETWYSSYLGPVIRDGQVTGFTLCAAEITERIQAREQLRLAETRLEHMNRIGVVGEMVAALTHEISQPLGAIANYADICLELANREEDLPPRLQEGLKLIQEQIMRSGEILHRLKRFLGKNAPTKEQERIKPVVEDALRLCQREILRQNLQIDLAVDEDSCFFGDPIQIQQVLHHLLNNAMEAMKHAPPEHRIIHIRCQSSDGNVYVEIQDRGMGVPAAHRERIFDPYFTTKPRGLGLGLSISRRIIEAHGGKLQLLPTSTSGARFQFFLPACEQQS